MFLMLAVFTSFTVALEFDATAVSGVHAANANAKHMKTAMKAAGMARARFVIYPLSRRNRVRLA